MKYLFYGEDLFFYLLNQSFPLDIERISELDEEKLKDNFLITDNTIFLKEDISIENIQKLCVFSDIIDTAFYKKHKKNLSKILFNPRDKYTFLEKLINDFTEKKVLNREDKFILSDSSVDVIISLEEIEYFSYNRRIKKSSATVGGKTYFLRKSLTSIEKFITKYDFIRVERGTILNKKKIREINYKEEYVLTNSGQKIYLGRSTLKKITENHFENFYKL